jgi:uncharacterized glyoxalase superfamily protein PhnB
MRKVRPVIAKVNIVAKHFDETLKFYRLLGLDIPDPTDQPPGSLHAEADNAEGSEFALDNEALARIYNAGRRNDAGCSSIVLTAFVPSRDEVDSTYAKLVAAGYRGQQPPYDAFWGARFAIVCDPEGNDVGLMSPVDEALRSWPPQDSPDP